MNYSDEWYTPIELFNTLNDEFHFDYDPCATDDHHLCDDYETIETNGLETNWSGRRVFCNPPYSKVSKWVEKAFREAQKDNTLVVMLIPSRTDTRYFHNFIYGRSEIRFVRGRLHFSKSDKPSPFPSMIIIFRGAYV